MMMREVQGHQTQASGVREAFLREEAAKKRSEDETELGMGKEENVSGRRSSTCKNLEERKRPWRMERS